MEVPHQSAPETVVEAKSRRKVRNRVAVRSDEHKIEQSFPRLKDRFYRFEQRGQQSQGIIAENKSIPQRISPGDIQAHRGKLHQLPSRRKRYEHQEAAACLTTRLLLSRSIIFRIFESSAVPNSQQPPLHAHHSPAHSARTCQKFSRQTCRLLPHCQQGGKRL